MASAAPRGRLRPGPAVPQPRQGKDRLSSTACLTKPAGKAASLASLTGLRMAARRKSPYCGDPSGFLRPLCACKPKTAV